LSKHALKVVETSVMGSYGTVLATLINMLLARVFWDPDRGFLYIIGLLLRPLLLFAIVVINGLGRILDIVTERHPTWVYLENAVICEKT